MDRTFISSVNKGLTIKCGAQRGEDATLARRDIQPRQDVTAKSLAKEKRGSFGEPRYGDR